MGSLGDPRDPIYCGDTESDSEEEIPGGSPFSPLPETPRLQPVSSPGPEVSSSSDGSRSSSPGPVPATPEILDHHRALSPPPAVLSSPGPVPATTEIVEHDGVVSQTPAVLSSPGPVPATTEIVEHDGVVSQTPAVSPSPGRSPKRLRLVLPVPGGSPLRDGLQSSSPKNEASPARSPLSPPHALLRGCTPQTPEDVKKEEERERTKSQNTLIHYMSSLFGHVKIYIGKLEHQIYYMLLFVENGNVISIHEYWCHLATTLANTQKFWDDMQAAHVNKDDSVLMKVLRLPDNRHASDLFHKRFQEVRDCIITFQKVYTTRYREYTSKMGEMDVSNGFLGDSDRQKISEICNHVDVAIQNLKKSVENLDKFLVEFVMCEM